MAVKKLTLPQFARLQGVAWSTAYGKVLRGEVPAVQGPNGRWTVTVPADTGAGSNAASSDG